MDGPNDDRPAQRRYWFRFNITMADALPLGVLLGCGVTAHDRADAERLLADRVFWAGLMPETIQAVEDVDVSILDPNHVRPNMGDPSRRGIWFPLGYDGEP